MLVPALELELQLGNRAGMVPGGDLAAIDGHFDFRAVLGSTRQTWRFMRVSNTGCSAALMLGREQRLKGAASSRPSRSGVRLGISRSHSRRSSRLGLVLGGLDGLHVTAAVLAHPQIDAEPVQRAIWRVEIGGDELLLLGGARLVSSAGCEAIRNVSAGSNSSLSSTSITWRAESRAITPHTAPMQLQARQAGWRDRANISLSQSSPFSERTATPQRAARRSLCQALNFVAGGSARSANGLRLAAPHRGPDVGRRAWHRRARVSRRDCGRRAWPHRARRRRGGTRR